MSILARYRKPGGFRQLIQLIETSQPVKQQQLLQAVESEDPRWAQLLRDKKITPEMVLDWDESYLLVVFEHMNTRHCATILYVLGKGSLLKFQNAFTVERLNEVNRLIKEMVEPSAVELRVAHIHMLETVRYLDEEKKIALSLIDPKLDISEAA